MSKGPISQFIQTHYLHFNSAALVDAAKGYETHLLEGGKMMITLAKRIHDLAVLDRDRRVFGAKTHNYVGIKVAPTAVSAFEEIACSFRPASRTA